MSLQLTMDSLEDAMVNLQRALVEEIDKNRRADLTDLLQKMQHHYTTYGNFAKRMQEGLNG